MSHLSPFRVSSKFPYLTPGLSPLNLYELISNIVKWGQTFLLVLGAPTSLFSKPYPLSLLVSVYLSLRVL